MLKIAFIPMSFLHFFAVFYKKYSDLLQVVLQCKKYSESTAGNGTQRKTVIFTADIFAVYVHPLFWDPELSRMHLHPQIQIPNAFPGDANWNRSWQSPFSAGQYL